MMKNKRTLFFLKQNGNVPTNKGGLTMKKRVLSLLLAGMMISAMLVGCGSTTQETVAETTAVETGTEAQTADATDVTDAKDKTYAIIIRSAGNPYAQKEMGGFEEAIEEYGGKCITKAPDEATAEAQITMVNELVAQKVDCIAIAANDLDALQPAVQAANQEGIEVISVDGQLNAESRLTHVNQADSEMIGRTLIQATSEMIGGEGQFAILSATSQSSNQNVWIDWMKEEMATGNYQDMELVEVAYGDDEFQKSVDQTEALLSNYPDLKAIVAPTTVGIMAAAKVVTDKGLIGDVVVTGLGLPSEMSEYISNGACPWMYLWNPIDVGYLAGWTSIAIEEGKITGAIGDKFSASRLGDYEITDAGDGGTEVLLGAPFKFDPDNIDEWKEVY